MLISPSLRPHYSFFSHLPPFQLDVISYYPELLQTNLYVAVALLEAKHRRRFLQQLHKPVSLGIRRRIPIFLTVLIGAAHLAI